jgi:hypothetical protein
MSALGRVAHGAGRHGGGRPSEDGAPAPDDAIQHLEKAVAPSLQLFHFPVDLLKKAMDLGMILIEVDDVPEKVDFRFDFGHSRRVPEGTTGNLSEIALNRPRNRTWTHKQTMSA